MPAGRRYGAAMDPQESETPPIEQLAQQQAEPQPVRVVQIYTNVVPTVTGLLVFLFALDEEGGIWERDHSMSSGAWHRIDGPMR